MNTDVFLPAEIYDSLISVRQRTCTHTNVTPQVITHPNPNHDQKKMVKFHRRK